nr:hypothetical protein [Vibrio lentus]
MSISLKSKPENKLIKRIVDEVCNNFRKLQRSTTQFQCVDNREPLYSKSEYEPTSSKSPIVWEALDGSTKQVGNIADNGDLCVTKEFAEIVMSFDPYGIECYPATLKLSDGSLTDRYLLALNNVIDVIDVVDVIDDVKSRLENILRETKSLLWSCICQKIS